MKSADEEAHGYQTASKNLYGILKAYAAENRKNMTFGERRLWEKLSHNGYNIKFRRQHIIGGFIVDFVCLSCRLVIEVDGAYHAELQQSVSDANRTFDLYGMGYTVIRFTDEAVVHDPEAVAEAIYKKVFLLLESSSV